MRSRAPFVKSQSDAASFGLAVGIAALVALLLVAALVAALSATVLPPAAAAATPADSSSAAASAMAPTSSPAPPPPPAQARPPIRAVRTSEAIVLDGALNEPVWQSDAAVSGLLQSQPHEGAPATERTEIRVAYDDEALYIGARMYDASPESVIAKLARKDNTTTADRFMVYIDSYHDHRTGFYFGVNAAGTYYDGTLFNDDWDDNSWDGVWDARARRDGQGWTAEMKIPFSQLRFQNADRHVWGINFSRLIPRKNERDYLVPRLRAASGFVSKFPDLVGLDGFHPPQRLSLAPYVTERAEYTQHPTGDPFHDGSSYLSKAGGDVKLGLPLGLTLDATANPDFGQVEVDPAVINLGDLETFYPEKRPFFLEGSNIFRFGNNGASNYNNFNWWEPLFFYSRRIGHAPQGGLPDHDFAKVPDGATILGAGKVTGQLPSGWTLGTLHAVTRREFAEVASGGARFDSPVEPLTYYGVARASKRLNEGRQGIGFMSTLAARQLSNPDIRDQFNRRSTMVGVDGWTFLDPGKVWVISGYATGTRVEGTRERMIALQRSAAHYFQRPDAQRGGAGGYLEVDSTGAPLDGSATRLWLNKEKGNSYCNAALGFQTPGFDIGDMGYFGYGDVINGHLSGGYNWNKAGRVRQFADVGGGIFRSHDFSGTKQVDGIAAWQDLTLNQGSGYNYFFAYNPPRLSDRSTRGGPRVYLPDGAESNIYLFTNQNRPLIFSLSVWGNRYGSSNSRGAGFQPGIDWRPGSNLSVSVSPSFDHSESGSAWVGAYGDTGASATYGVRYVTAPLVQNTLDIGVRFNWTFSPRASLQLYMQPYFVAGDYGAPKFLLRGRTDDYITFGNGGSTFDPATRVGDADGPGPAQALTIPNRDFNYRSLRGSAVMRWEYQPGSTVYFVWTQSRDEDEPFGDLRLNRSMRRLLDLHGDNIFMVKISYWWSA